MTRGSSVYNHELTLYVLLHVHFPKPSATAQYFVYRVHEIVQIPVLVLNLPINLPAPSHPIIAISRAIPVYYKRKIL